MVKNYMLAAEYKRQYDRDSVVKMFIAEEKDERICMEYAYLIDRKYYWFRAHYMPNEKNMQQVISITLMGHTVNPSPEDMKIEHFFDSGIEFLESSKVKEMNIINLKTASEQSVYLHNAKQRLYDGFIADRDNILKSKSIEDMPYSGRAEKVLGISLESQKPLLGKIVSILSYMNKSYMRSKKPKVSVGCYDAKHVMERILGEYVPQEVFVGACLMYFDDIWEDISLKKEGSDWTAVLPEWYDVLEVLGGK